MSISTPVVIILAAALVALVLGARIGSSGGSGGPGGWGGYGPEEHVPWGGADEPWHPRDRDLRDRYWKAMEAVHAEAEGHSGKRGARMDERYGGDFTSGDERYGGDFTPWDGSA